MATRLQGRIPGGRRRYEVKKTIRRQSGVAGGSPVLGSPSARKSFAQGGLAKPGSIIEPEDDEISGNDSVADFATDDITPDFLQDGSDDDESEDDVADQENDADTDGGNETAQNDAEQNLQDDEPTDEKPEDDVNYTGGPKKKSLRQQLTSKKAAILAGVAGSIVTVAIGVITYGPSFLLNHIGNIINGKIGEISSSHRVKYRKTKFARVKDMFTIDGRRGSKIVSEMEKDGYKFIYGKGAERNVLKGVTLPDRKNTILNIALEDGTNPLSDHISDYMEVRHPLRTSGWRTKRSLAVKKTFGIRERPITQASPDDLDDPDKTINKNQADAIYDEELQPDIDRTNVDEPGDDATDEQKAAAAQAEDEVEDIATNDGSLSSAKKAAQEAGENIAGDAEEILDSIDNVSTNEILDIGEKAAKSGSLIGKSFTALKSFLNPTDLADRICTIKNRLRTTQTAIRATKALALFRQMMGGTQGAVDAMKMGTGDSKLTGSFMKKLTQKDRNGFTIGHSPGLAFAIKGKFSKNRNSLTRNEHAVDGKYTGFWKTLQKKTDDFPGTSKGACGVWQNPLAQGAIAAVSIVVGFFTGGESTVAVEAGQSAVKTALKKAIEDVTIKSIFKAIGKSILIELSFEGIMTLAQIYAEKNLTFPVSGQSVGEAWMNENITGASKGAELRGSYAGQVPATPAQYAAARVEFLAEKKESMKKQSFFARILDLENPDSLAFNVSSTIAFGALDVTGSATAVTNNIARAPSTLFASLSRTFVPKSLADESDPDEIAYETYETEGDNSGIQLATDPGGSLLTIMRSDISSIDPDENIAFLGQSGDIDGITLQPKSEAFLNHIKNCVETMDRISVIEGADSSNPAEDCMANLGLTKRFKAHLAYLDMVDGLDAELFPEELDGSASGTQPISTAPTNTGASSQYIPDCNANGGNAQIACVAIDTMLGIPYKNGYSKVPGCLQSPAAANDPSPAALDCSAFTAMAVYRAFGATAPRASVLYLNDANFQVVGDTRTSTTIGDIRSIQPGDLIGKGSVASGSGGNGHIGIVVSYNPATQELVTVETDRCSEPSRIVTTKGLKIDGRGSYEWAVRYIGPKGTPQ